MYNTNSVSISTIVYYYFMHLRAADKTVAPGAEDDPIYYPPRPQGRGRSRIGSSTALRATELTVASIRHGIFV